MNKKDIGLWLNEYDLIDYYLSLNEAILEIHKAKIDMIERSNNYEILQGK